MESRTRSLLVSRIMFGAIRCHVGNQIYYLGSPNGFQLFVSNEVYNDAYNIGVDSGMFSEDEAVTLLMEHGMWSDQEQKTLDDYPDKIEKTKLELYDYQLRIGDFKLCKKRLEIYRTEMLALLNKRHTLDYITVEGFASFCKLNYLMGAALKDQSFNPIWHDESFFNDDSGILDEVRGRYNESRLNDLEIRELSRMEPWRLIWSTGNKTNMFGRSPLEMTTEQRNLVAWSRLYDSIYESMEPPPDTVINDDDLLDAWLILQRRKREERANSTPGESQYRVSKNDKINNAQNVFIMMGDDVDPLTGKKIQMVSNIEEARKLDSIISSPEVKAVKQMRFAAMEQMGDLRHHQLPDIRQDLIVQRNNLEIQNKKGKIK